MRKRRPIATPPGSREFVDALLGGLKAGQYRPGAWARLVLICAHRSLEQVAAHPRAALEVAGIGSVLLALGGVRLCAAAGCRLALTISGCLGNSGRWAPPTLCRWCEPASPQAGGGAGRGRSVVLGL